MATRFERWLEKQERGTVMRISREIGIRHQVLSRYIRGERIPPLLTALAIEKATGGAVGVQDLAKRVSGG